MKYCNSVYSTSRFKTREVKVGKIGIGGDNPIRIQSMTTSNTRDVEATIEQAIRLADAGCDIVRMTVQGIKEAESCEAIKSGLLQRGYDIPLVADIHFYPPAAMKVVEFVDKVRINPGNFLDKRAQFKTLIYDDESYEKELEKIKEGFTPLVLKCKELKKALRIGTNHGSLSDRIMNRFGDTPRGMVESALEFARVARELDFHDMIFSMKASNPIVMIEAYRLLVANMQKMGWDYPIHLGVTEAGEGEDGRVKSAVGIGSLLLDGIGDTIRVSLTEDPWKEVDPCKRLVNVAKEYLAKSTEPFDEQYRDVFSLPSRKAVFKAPLHPKGSVITAISEDEILKDSFFEDIGAIMQLGTLSKGSICVDAVLLEDRPKNEKALKKLTQLDKAGIGVFMKNNPLSFAMPIYDEKMLQGDLPSIEHGVMLSSYKSLASIDPKLCSLILFSANQSALHETRRFYQEMRSLQISIPLLFDFSYDTSFEDTIIKASAEMGALFTDAIGDGLCLRACHPLKQRMELSFAILQASRLRTVKTEFISCPGCGRTLFELQEVSRRIREKTSHLPGVKIAIMGCIVNGPGEMADADFGYVGSRPGKIDLYIGKQCIEKNIDFADADDRLIALIKSEGKWIDP